MRLDLLLLDLDQFPQPNAIVYYSGHLVPVLAAHRERTGVEPRCARVAGPGAAPRCTHLTVGTSSDRLASGVRADPTPRRRSAANAPVRRARTKTGRSAVRASASTVAGGARRPDEVHASVSTAEERSPVCTAVAVRPSEAVDCRSSRSLGGGRMLSRDLSEEEQSEVEEDLSEGESEAERRGASRPRAANAAAGRTSTE